MRRGDERALVETCTLIFGSIFSASLLKFVNTPALLQKTACHGDRPNKQQPSGWPELMQLHAEIPEKTVMLAVAHQIMS
jgi:hypothetical protein